MHVGEAGVPLMRLMWDNAPYPRARVGMECNNITEKFARFSEQWQPKIVAELNGQEVKLVKGSRGITTMTWKRCL